MKEPPRFYERNLPHWQPEGVTFATQFCLAGCLPRHVVQQLQAERDELLLAVAKKRAAYEEKHPDGLPEELEQELERLALAARNQYRGKFDDLLDGTSYGPTWLAQPEIATILQRALHFAEENMGRWRLHAYCIMPNHVHLIVSDVQPVLHKVLGSVKQYSGRLANQQLGLTGQSFWHVESYDHIIRNEKEYDHQVRYVLNNPVKAGLVDDWADWPFTFFRLEA